MSLFSIDLERELTYEAVAQFLALNGPPELRPQEGARLDFKSALVSDIGDHVAAMANAVGGLIFLGVHQARAPGLAVPDAVPGLQGGDGELRSRLVDSIVSAVQPRPPFSVGVAPIPRREGHAVAVVRVEEGLEAPYMYIKGGVNRIPIRTGDTTRAASLEEVRALFRRAERSWNAVAEVRSGLGDPYVLEGLRNYRCARYMRITWWPSLPMPIRLERAVESRFVRLVRAHFARYAAMTYEQHASGSYTDLVGADEDRNISAMWRLSEQGGLAYVTKLSRLLQHPPTQLGTGEVALIGDWMVDSLAFVRLVQRWARERAYWGSGLLTHEMQFQNVREVMFEAGVPTTDPTGFGRLRGVVLGSSSVEDRALPSTRQTPLNPGAVDDATAIEIVADAILHHVRNLGGGGDFGRLREDLSELLASLDGGTPPV